MKHLQSFVVTLNDWKFNFQVFRRKCSEFISWHIHNALFFKSAYCNLWSVPSFSLHTFFSHYFVLTQITTAADGFREWSKLWALTAFTAWRRARFCRLTCIAQWGMNAWTTIRGIPELDLEIPWSIIFSLFITHVVLSFGSLALLLGEHSMERIPV